ncbi:MAG: hypothetical protein MJZ38_05260 [archaeon]|nr:hypothetical protein [archaeon]
MSNFSEYTLHTPWTNVANGKYVFATKGGRDYFIKNFLNHKYPNRELCSPETFARLEREVTAWENKRKELLKSLAACRKNCQYIFPPEELIREKSNYYMISRRISETPLTVEQISALGRADKLSIMRKIAEALVELSRESIIHGDLKPENIFIIKTASGYEPRIMDFDDSYYSGKPPEPDATVGSMEFYSPELGMYTGTDGYDAANLTCLSDIFAAGLIFHLYTVGERGDCQGGKYPCQLDALRRAVDRAKYPRDQKDIADLVKLMLAVDYHERITAEDVLKGIEMLERKESVAGLRRSAPTSTSRSSARIVKSDDGYTFKKLAGAMCIVTTPDGTRSLLAMAKASTLAAEHGVDLGTGSTSDVPAPAETHASGTSSAAPRGHVGGSADPVPEPEPAPVTSGPSSKIVVEEVKNDGRQYVIRYPDGHRSTIPRMVYDAMKRQGKIE